VKNTTTGFSTMLRPLIFATCVLAISGCANPYAKFYQGIPDARALPAYDASDTSFRVYSTNDFNRDRINLMRQSYLEVGRASFTGPASNVTAAQLEEQARKVGAQVVLLSSKYSHTNSGAIPLTMPTSTTSHTSSTATAYGSGGSATAYGNSTTTTYGTQTTMLPYSVDIANFGAIFFAKSKSRTGIFPMPLDDDTRKRLQSNRGIIVQVVAEGSTAYRSDILPGDVILSIADEPIDSVKTYSMLVNKYGGRTVKFHLNRDGKELDKDIEIRKLD
jgi:C-terminal processing protease CtpA/Prc